MTNEQGIFAEQICALRKEWLSKRKKREPDQPIAAWIEKDRLIEGVGDSLVIIMNSTTCEWAKGPGGGCSMCGYSNETSDTLSATNLIAQVRHALDKFSSKSFQAIKIFNSGSFLNAAEVPIKAQNTIMERIAKIPAVSELILETRPEFVTQETLQRLKEFLGKEKALELGIGLESSNDLIRIHNINKGFTFDDFLRAVKIALDLEVRVKSYLLLKPPFLTEKEAIDDIIKSAIDSIKIGARSISINPMNIQNGTLVYSLWRKKLYRAPWIWSVKEVIQEIWKEAQLRNLEDNFDRIVSDPSGAGTRRGIHNCKKCDKKFLKLIKNYSLKQDPSLLDRINCSCHALWRELLLFEEASREQSLVRAENAMRLLS
ncbi:MAG: TIGR01210 family radical SAM protein [Candidatus Heimdallarchaeota archaeon]|nr:TIGR01210 family radical SAM protein [Candidatus Heimdallarchaeota archaeon]